MGKVLGLPAEGLMEIGELGDRQVVHSCPDSPGMELSDDFVARDPATRWIHLDRVKMIAMDMRSSDAGRGSQGEIPESVLISRPEPGARGRALVERRELSEPERRLNVGEAQLVTGGADVVVQVARVREPLPGILGETLIAHQLGVLDQLQVI